MHICVYMNVLSKTWKYDIWSLLMPEMEVRVIIFV